MEQNSNVCVSNTVFIHLWVDEHVDWAHFLATVNSTAVKMVSLVCDLESWVTLQFYLVLSWSPYWFPWFLSSGVCLLCCLEVASGNPIDQFREWLLLETFSDNLEVFNLCFSSIFRLWGLIFSPMIHFELRDVGPVLFYTCRCLIFQVLFVEEASYLFS